MISNSILFSILDCFPNRSVPPSKWSRHQVSPNLSFYCESHKAVKSLRSYRSKRFAGFWEVLLIGQKLVMISVVPVSHYHSDVRHVQHFSANSVHAWYLDWKPPQYFLYCFRIRATQINIKTSYLSNSWWTLPMLIDFRKLIFRKDEFRKLLSLKILTFWYLLGIFTKTHSNSVKNKQQSSNQMKTNKKKPTKYNAASNFLLLVAKKTKLFLLLNVCSLTKNTQQEPCGAMIHVI